MSEPSYDELSAAYKEACGLLVMAIWAIAAVSYTWLTTNILHPLMGNAALAIDVLAFLPSYFLFGVGGHWLAGFLLRYRKNQ